MREYLSLKFRNMRRMSEPLQAKVKSKVITTANVTPVPAAGVLLFIQEVLLCQPDVQIKKDFKVCLFD